MQREKRIKRHFKVRKDINGSSFRPRLAVFRSSQHIFAQLIDDDKGVTLAAESDIKMNEKITKKEKSYLVGKNIATLALKKKVTQVVFDRGGFLYAGRVAQLARGAREGGLKF